MKLHSAEQIFCALADAKVRYLVVGGLAVNAHGYQRFTKDIDIVLQLTASNIFNAFEALQRLGYQPNVPVTAQQFADPQQRQQWIEQKGMQVLQLWSDQHPETPVDLFVSEPFDFEHEHQQGLTKSIDGNRTHPIEIHFASAGSLIAMKRLANRSQDQIDIEHLQTILDHGKD